MALCLATRPVPVQAAAVALGVAALSLSSYVSIPMVPVPITAQTLAVTLVGALCGWRLGGLAISLWLVLGALGAPVLAGGTGGIARFLGPSAGYLFAFVLAGACTGWLVEHGWDGRRYKRALVTMLAGNAICLAIGAAWLAVRIGPAKALAAGLLPFLPGALAKAALGALVLYLVDRKLRARETGSG